MQNIFDSREVQEANIAGRERPAVEKLLKPRIVRNKKNERRQYHLVNRDGEASRISGDPFRFDDKELSAMLKDGSLIDLTPDEAIAYVTARDQLAEAQKRHEPVFVSQALRQLLSTWEQFRYSASAHHLEPNNLPTPPHPKMVAATRLVGRLMGNEATGAEKQGWIGKVLIFTTFVGSDRPSSGPKKDKAYGTAVALKKALTKCLAAQYPKPAKEQKAAIVMRLVKVVKEFVKEHKGALKDAEYNRLCHSLKRFAGTGLAHVLLSDSRNLMKESCKLQQLLQTRGDNESSDSKKQ